MTARRRRHRRRRRRATCGCGGGRRREEGGGGGGGRRAAAVGARSTNTRVCASPKTGKHSVSKWSRCKWEHNLKHKEQYCNKNIGSDITKLIIVGKPKQFRFGFGRNMFRFRCFGYLHFRLSAKTCFFPKCHVLAQIWVKDLQQNHTIFGRNTEFRPKQAVSAKTASFGRNKCFGLVVLISVSVFRPKFCFVCPLID